MRVDDGVVYIKDLNSTNKTRIIKKEVKTSQQGHVIEELKKNKEEGANDDMAHYYDMMNHNVMGYEYHDVDNNFDDVLDDLF